ncbi:hypothetical protein [Poriferisphaera sp. WC338]|uniref:hypothetical protein n=1 Tax=Poriferisphaera sp. WC338 TaxID=3425129 RepID=UPI003D819513
MNTRWMLAAGCLCSWMLVVFAEPLAQVGYGQAAGEAELRPGEGVISEVERLGQEQAVEKAEEEAGRTKVQRQDQGAPADADARQFTDLEAPVGNLGAGFLRSGRPLADFVVTDDAVIGGRRMKVWKEAGDQMILVEGEARFAVGLYAFRGTSAVVRIKTENRPGMQIRDIAVYMNDATPAGALYGGGAKGGPIAAGAKRLLITSSTTGKVRLNVDLLEPADVVPNDVLVKAAAGRFDRYDASLNHVLDRGPAGEVYSAEVFALRAERRAAIGAELTEAEKVFLQDAQTRLAESTKPAAGGVVGGSTANAGVTGEEESGSTGYQGPEIFPAQGLMSYSIDGSLVLQELGEDELAVMMTGGARLGYQDFEADRAVTLKAQRVVLFLDRAVLEGKQVATGGGELNAGSVKGIYLEDNVVISDGDYTVRAPRVYYDLATNKALLLDAVMYAYDVTRKLPLYVRADALRQTSATSFEAEDALFTTSEFGEPHFAIAASKVTIDEVQREGVTGRYVLKSYDNTFKIGQTPVAYFPFVAGENFEIPIREVRGGFNSRWGPFIETDWDMFSLFGREKPEGVEATGKIGWLGQHNGSLGFDLNYDIEDIKMYGDLRSYLIPLDGGEDELGEGRFDVNRSGDTRGFVNWKHFQKLDYGVDLALGAQWVSDNTFLEEFFYPEADEVKPYELSAYLKKQDRDGWIASGLGRTNPNSFTQQLTVLQFPGYVVDKVPELKIQTTPFVLFGDKVNWYSDSSATILRVRAGTDTPASRGFEPGSSLEVFGFNTDLTFKSQVEARGIPVDLVGRLDTRHELDIALKSGIFNISPYVSGRVTAYDQSFEDFNDFEAPRGSQDQIRFWGMAGVRIDTEFAKTLSLKRDRLWNINGIRHVVEPYVNAYAIGTTLSSRELPLFDYDVERLDEGFGLALGLRNTLKTKRGGPGRERDVDWISLETRYVFKWDEAFPNVEIPEYYNYRPEFSVGGDQFYGELLWMVSDNVAITGELTWAEAQNEVVQWRVGGTLNHTPRLTSFLRYEALPVLSSRNITYGFTYRLTTKYNVSFLQRFDFEDDRSRVVQVVVDRKLPRWTLRVTASIDTVDQENNFNVVIIPDGLIGTNLWAGRPLQF